MIRISQIKMPLSHDEKMLLVKAAGLLHIKAKQIRSFQIVKKSIDARKKPDIFLVYVLDLEILEEDKVLARIHDGRIQKASDVSYRFAASGETLLEKKPVIIGSGPAGLFCGYQLALHGYQPVILERGKDVKSRMADVETFWKTGKLLPDSNVQFGEGGAGTFSDGKLNTLIKDKYGRNKEVLRILADAGAPEEILYESKPHIGTDILIKVVEQLRRKILQYGGEIYFESKVTDLIVEKNRIQGVIVNKERHILTDIVVLAVGHSARDTFYMLYEKKVPLESKAFAVGLRVEHPRRFINMIQYGMEENDMLKAADYKLTAHASDGRGVYSFCMCPGGYVVNASSEKEALAVNGMSYSGRNGENSNSAVIVTVTPDDYPDKHPLSGVAFQRELEKKAYLIGQGRVPVETYGEFKEAVIGRKSDPSKLKERYPDFMPAVKGAYQNGPVHEIMPDTLNRAFVEGMEQFGNYLPGFDDSGVYVSGIESRTSSPVRIGRDESGQSAVRGLYPCGEGAGYAGGITSAAMDGMYIAEKIAEKYRPFT